MHSPELIDQFIDLRIQGATLIEISEKLSVPKSTLRVPTAPLNLSCQSPAKPNLRPCYKTPLNATK